MYCCARENCNLFRMIRLRYGLKLLIKYNFLKYNKYYIQHDTFGKYINRAFKCQITKHSNTRDISCDGELARKYCFDCDGYIDE